MGPGRRRRGLLEARPSVVSQLRGGDVGADGFRRAAAPGRPVLEAPLSTVSLIEDTWSGEDVSIAEIERELARLRYSTTVEGGQPNLRTSVMTHIAWVPPSWLDVAETTLMGMAE